MRALDLKLWRDLRRLWPQALAIACVMAAGVATMTGELLRALEERIAARADRQGVRLRIVPSSLGALTDRFLLLALLEALLDDLLAGLDGGRVVIGCRRGSGSARIVIAASRPAPPAAAVDRGATVTPDDPAGPARSVADAIAESLGVVLRRAAGRRDIALPLVRLPPALMPPAPVSNAPSPVAPPAPSALRADSDSDTGDDPPADRRILGARVLVIMRDGHARAVIAALVRAEGHAVRTARDTAAARALLREEGASVDLLLGESAEGPDALARLAMRAHRRAPVDHMHDLEKGKDAIVARGKIGQRRHRRAEHRGDRPFAVGRLAMARGAGGEVFLLAAFEFVVARGGCGLKCRDLDARGDEGGERHGGEAGEGAVHGVDLPDSGFGGAVAGIAPPRAGPGVGFDRRLGRVPATTDRPSHVAAPRAVIPLTPARSGRAENDARVLARDRPLTGARRAASLRMFAAVAGGER